MSVEVITAITGDKDAPRDDVQCFTGEGKFTDPTMEAKIYKVLTHKYVDAEYSIWVDGNIYLLIEPERLIKEWLADGEYDLAVFKHPWRDCIYDEEKELQKYYPDISDVMKKQIAHYQDKGFPEHNGMGECGVIVRKHSPKMARFNEAWWAEICKWCRRDQLSFPYILSMSGLKTNFIEGNVREHKYFIYNQHKK